MREIVWYLQPANIDISLGKKNNRKLEKNFKTTTKWGKSFSKEVAVVTKVCNYLWFRFPQQSRELVPQCILYASCVSSPSYSSDLYSAQRCLGPSHADGSKSRPAGSAGGLRAHRKNSAGLHRTGVSTHYITSCMFTCSILIWKWESCQIFMHLGPPQRSRRAKENTRVSCHASRLLERESRQGIIATTWLTFGRFFCFFFKYRRHLAEDSVDWGEWPHHSSSF